MFRLHAVVLVVLAVLAALALLASDAPARTWTVRPDGSGDAPTIQAAIDLASYADVIELTDGTFTGDGNRDLDPSGKLITIRSQSGDPRLCRIDCDGSLSDPHRAFLIHSGEGRETVIDGIWMVRGYAESGGGIYLGATSPTIRTCAITGCKAVRGGGVYVDGAAAWFRGTTISGNLADEGGGFYCTSQAYPDLQFSIVWGSCADHGPEIWLSDGWMSLQCCCVDFAGIDGTGQSGLWYIDNIEVDPLFCDPASCRDAPSDGGDYTLAAGSPCLLQYAPCQVQYGAFGQGCEGPVPVLMQTWGRIKSGFLERPAGSR